MQHTITPTDTGLRITAHVAAEQQDALLTELQHCAAGTCSCPTPQYAKLQSIAIQAQPGTVSVELTAKPGEQIDPEDIARCLEHTARQVGG